MYLVRNTTHYATWRLCMPPRFTAAPHLFDYSKGYHSGQILNEWLAWIEAMAPFDNGIYD